MSGRKQTRISLAQQREQALAQCDQVESAARQSEGLLAQLDGAVSQAVQGGDAYRELLVTLRQVVETARDQCRQARQQALSWLVSAQTLRAAAQGATGLIQQLRQLDGQVQVCCAGLGIRAQCHGFQTRLASQKERLSYWEPTRYEGLVNDARQLGEQVENAILARQDTSSARQRLQGMDQRLQELEARVSQCEQQHRRREMVCACLKESCRQLAYDFHLQPLAHPSDPLVCEVNTYIHGTIVFRLELEGLLRSQSERWRDERQAEFANTPDGGIEMPCRHWVEAVTEKMKDFGAEIDFSYEANNQPVLESYTEKGIPNQQKRKKSGEASE